MAGFQKRFPGGLVDNVTTLFHGDFEYWDQAIYELKQLTTGNPDNVAGQNLLQIGANLGLDPTMGRSLYLSNTYVTVGPSNRVSAQQIEATVLGTGPAGPQPYIGVYTDIQDASTVNTWTVSNAVNNGSGLIRLTATGHGLNTGDAVGVYSVGGVPNANGQWVVTKIDANTVDLQSSTFAGAYTSGGKITNRGAFYGALFGIVPKVSRDGGLTGTASHADDVLGVSVFNGGSAPANATGAYDVNRNSTGFPGTAIEYFTGYGVEANVAWAFRATGYIQNYGLSLEAATYGLGAINLPNNVGVYGRNAANSADIFLFQLASDNTLTFGSAGTPALNYNSGVFFNWAVNIADAVNVVLGSTTGTKIGTATGQKLGFYNATPVVQPNGTGNTHTVAAGSTTSVFTNTTFDGSVGSTAYTVGDIVKALKNLGLIAA